MAASRPSRTTIIIPAYNYERYVAEAIQSALNQDDPDVEVMVVDDGSTDRTGEIAKGFGERITYVHKQNAGLSAARNTGVKAARSEFVAFLDADDLMAPNAISTFHRRLAELGPGFGLLGCSHAEIKADGTYVREALVAPEGGAELTARDFLLRNRFGPCVLTRAAIIKDVGYFDESLRACEDRDMWLRIGASGHRICFLSDVLVQMRRHGENMSADPDRQAASIRRVLQKAQAAGVVSKWNIFFWARTWSVYHYQKSSMLWNRNRRGEARKHLLFSLLLWPFFSRTAPMQWVPFFRLRRVIAWTFKRS